MPANLTAKELLRPFRINWGDRESIFRYSGFLYMMDTGNIPKSSCLHYDHDVQVSWSSYFRTVGNWEKMNYSHQMSMFAEALVSKLG